MGGKKTGRLPPVFYALALEIKGCQGEGIGGIDFVGQGGLLLFGEVPRLRRESRDVPFTIGSELVRARAVGQCGQIEAVAIVK